ncbi:MAG: hypothetical protein E7298_05095 [Lachnospiraceae bacterium]|nr:hypothetical protein [Lachnospiraceae bacterium]
MGTYVFAALTALLAAALIISGINRKRTIRLAIFDRIKKEFGSTEDLCGNTDVFDYVPALFGYMMSKDKGSFCLDDITLSDLSIRDVYSRMNRCVTNAGEEYLYCRFRLLEDDPSSFHDRADIYTKDTDTAVRLIYILESTMGRMRRDGFANISAIKEARRESIAVDVIPLALLVISLCVIPFSHVPGIIATIVMLCVSVWGYFKGIRSTEDSLAGFATSMRIIKCADRLSKNGCGSFEAYKDLTGLLFGNFLISERDATSSSPLSILLDYVKMITHIDIIVYKLKVSTVVRYIDRLEELYLKLGELDCTLAIASYIKGRKHCRAQIIPQKRIDTKQIYHPLVKNPVYNDFTAERGVLITGSNASGKSTFLKAIAVNVLFAQTFGLAFADSFATGKFRIYTSMALADNILANESYYVVEARSIKRMCDTAAPDCLFIIDEVLRGTNTVERIAAATNILKYLCDSGALCFAATHDRELTLLLEDKMELYHFTEEINEDSVTFPFVIKEGVSDKTNAISLLKMLGFDKTVTSSADRLVEQYNKTGSWISRV